MSGRCCGRLAMLLVATFTIDAAASMVLEDAMTVEDSSASRRKGATLLRREAELLEAGLAQGAGQSPSATASPESADDADTLQAVSKSMTGYRLAGLSVNDTDGDDGDSGFDPAGDRDIDGENAKDTMSDNRKPYTIWEKDVDDERLILHWLDFGCVSSLSDNKASFAAHSRFEHPQHRVGHVQCCGISNDTSGTYCTRLDPLNGNGCFGGSGLYTMMEARNMCNAAKMRLCTREELSTEDSLGCCTDECNLNQELVWTSTHDVTTVRRNNDAMKKEIDRLEAENSALKDDHESMREEYRVLVAEMQEYYDKHPTTPSTTHAAPHTTLPYGYSAADMQELKDSLKFTRESHREIEEEAIKLSQEWKAIMKHSPNVELQGLPEQDEVHVGPDIHEKPQT